MSPTSEKSQVECRHPIVSCDSEHPINEELLMKMPKDATLINAARPERVHEARDLRFSARDQTSVTSPMRHPRASKKRGARRRQVHEARLLHQEEERRRQITEASRFVYTERPSAILSCPNQTQSRSVYKFYKQPS